MSPQEIPYQNFPAIRLDTLKAYANASGDFNPIHTDEETAKKVGLPGVIAHGMLISAYLSKRAQDFVETDLALGDFNWVDFQTRFKAMVFLGDIPSIGGTVRTQTETELVLDLIAKNQKGEITTVGSAHFKKSIAQY